MKTPVLLLAFLSLTAIQAQIPVINAVIPNAASVEKWGKFELKINLNASYSNPYNFDEVSVKAVFTDPDGVQVGVDGFYMQDYTVDNPSTGSISPAGTGGFRVRFAPNKTGVWKYNLSCTTAAGTGVYPQQTFQVTAVANADNRGFIRNDQTNYLHFDNGAPYVPIGENICWHNNNAILDYSDWLTKLKADGGNALRVWQSSWGFGLEWNNGINGYQGLRRYKQSSAFLQDWLFDYCADKGMYIELCLHSHGQVSTQVNPEWSNSPYNSANGGPCANTWDFFTNPAAINHVKNRLRYIVARWGYARSILNWELFNEVDWTDQFEQRKDDVVNWLAEMAGYLKSIDPNKHLVSSSYAQDIYDPMLWNQPDIDYTQTHYYIQNSNLERSLVKGQTAYLNDFGKPTWNAEFGLVFSGEQTIALDPTGIHLHNCLWGTVLGGGMGGGMTWWWDSYVGPQNLYSVFKGVSNFAQQANFASDNMAPATVSISNAPADLSLQPSLGWGVLADQEFTISNGEIIPANAKLGRFLYGSQWNTQFRRPPTFHVSYPQSGIFRVKTSADAGQAPKIAIWVDNVKILEQNAAVNTTYTVNISAGTHDIRVDNTGTDWITIDSYLFQGLGKGVDAYVLKSENSRRLAGWLLNNQYNQDRLRELGAPPSIPDSRLTVQGVENGAYVIQYHDCISGLPSITQSATASNGTLTFTVPDLSWDLAFTAEKTSDTRQLQPEKSVYSLTVSPNPAPAGGLVRLQPDARLKGELTLRDEQGQLVLQCGQVDNPISIAVPETMAAGIYWLNLHTPSGKNFGTKLVICR